MALERTLIILKPDAVQRGLMGRILGRFEDKGLKVVGAKFMQIDGDLAATHYESHQGKPFYEGLVVFMTSSPVLVGDRVYTIVATGELICVDARTGKTAWKKKLGPDQLHASPAYAPASSMCHWRMEFSTSSSRARMVPRSSARSTCTRPAWERQPSGTGNVSS